MAKFVKIIVFAFFFINSSLGEVLNCEYLYYDDDGYNCKMKDSYQEQVEVTSVSGEHKMGRDEEQLKTLYIPSSNLVKYIPLKICNFFPNLEKFDIYTNSIVEIHKENFEGCPKIKYIYLRNLKFTKFDDDLFSNLPLLMEVSVTGSSLQILQKDLFKNNPNINSLMFNNNKLNTIDLELTTEQINNIKKFILFSNVCINEGYRQDDYRSPPLRDLINNIASKCKTVIIDNVNNSTTTSTTTPIPTEDPDEQRIVILERKIEEMKDTRHDLSDRIQISDTRIQKDLTMIEMKIKLLSSDVEKLEKYINSNLTYEIDRVKGAFEKLTNSVDKIQLKSNEFEATLNENEKIRDENDGMQSEINHNKNLIISVFLLQIVTVIFAICITIYFKAFFNFSKNFSNNVR